MTGDKGGHSFVPFAAKRLDSGTNDDDYDVDIDHDDDDVTCTRTIVQGTEYIVRASKTVLKGIPRGRP